MYKSIKKSALVLVTLLWGCAPKQRDANIRIKLTNNSQSIALTGISRDILQEIARDSATAVWQSLAPVYRMPADTDLKDFQKPQPGKYIVSGNAVVFTPDTPFTAQIVYFVRYFRYDDGNTPADYITSHKKLGQTPYTDLIFKR
jgi:hypothetical protein